MRLLYVALTTAADRHDLLGNSNEVVRAVVENGTIAVVPTRAKQLRLWLPQPEIIHPRRAARVLFDGARVIAWT